MDERSKLLGNHNEESGSQAEAESMGPGLVNFPFEGHLEETPRLGVNGKVEVCVLKLMLYIHIPGVDKVFKCQTISPLTQVKSGKIKEK